MKNINLNIDIIHYVALKDKVFMARQISTMLGAGIPIDQCFKILSYQEKKPYLKSVYDAILQDIEAGHALSFAITRHPKVFDPVFVAVIRSGETTGQLEKVLLQMADRMEIIQQFQSKLRSALMYPAFVVVSMFIIIYLMMIYIVPPLKSVFEETGAELPWTTQMIVSMSDFTVKYWWLELVVLSIVVLSLFLFFRTRKGGSVWDRIKIITPGLKGLYQLSYMARFCRTMSILIEAGTPIIETIVVSSETIQNVHYYNTLRRVASQVERGMPMSVQIRREPLFPAIVAQMMVVGEQTGKMGVVMEKMAEFYERETENLIKGIASLIEPLLIVIIGLGVGFLVYSIIFPIYNIASLNL